MELVQNSVRCWGGVSVLAVFKFGFFYQSVVAWSFAK